MTRYYGNPWIWLSSREIVYKIFYDKENYTDLNLHSQDILLDLWINRLVKMIQSLEITVNYC